MNGTTVLSNVSYGPFGPAHGWTWGNGNAFSRAFDGDGDITGISTTGSQESLSYDDASRIGGIMNTAPGSLNWTYGYDPLDRLISATSSSVNEGWTYDANGNRLSETGTAPSNYSISPTNDEVTGITGTRTRTYGYDAAGNTLSDSIDADTYNDAGRLKTVTNSSGTTTFIYNALGQMIEASGPSGATLYAYDIGGHLIGEYDGSGNLIQETVWLGDIPVATIRPSGSSVAIYYVVTDQLDTPREVVRPSDNALMWSWFTGPFGTEVPNTNPQGAGTFAYDLRFPGQVAGAWGSTYQNYFRDYDQVVSRYVESDPLGPDGGSYSTYAYVASSPLISEDPTGLDWHHVFPRANWNRGQYSREARQIFDKYTLQTKGGHGWTKGHSAYNQATREQADRFCRENDINPSEMTESQANDLLQSILDSNDPRIHDFLSSELQTPPFAPNQSGFFVPGELTPWGLFILGLTYSPGAH